MHLASNREENTMKRVIDGVTYNTDTATLIAKADDDTELDKYSGEPAKSLELRLYQTRGGAFFLHMHTETSRANSEGEWRDIVRDEFEPLTASEAQHWVAKSGYQVEVLNDVFGEPPEAAAEAQPGATLYVRVPASLKEQIEAAAEMEKVSVNAWMMRCAEFCIVSRNQRGQPLN
jgi:predicted HicB family RNase H-like nuclease